MSGVVRRGGGPLEPQRVKNLIPSRRILERSSAEGDRPVGERVQTLTDDLEYHGTREILWEAGRTTFQG